MTLLLARDSNVQCRSDNSGNISREAVMKGREAIRAEVMHKVPHLMEKGGFIPALDDAVMPDMRFENVKYCCELIKSIRC
jgi:hypothetical protein